MPASENIIVAKQKAITGMRAREAGEIVDVLEHHVRRGAWPRMQAKAPSVMAR